MCTQYMESQKMVAIATSLTCNVPAISAFCLPTIQTSSITNCLVAIVLTKPVITTLVPKLVAMATSLSTCEPRQTRGSLVPPKSSTQTASRSVQPFLHSSPQSVPILYNGTPLSPSKLLLPMGDLDPHLIHGSLGPPESTTKTAFRSVQSFLQGSLV